tara:strand:+ start:1206 stop:1511 length:306 start_codon:yes stop_codon:yes gene_type:complete
MTSKNFYFDMVKGIYLNGEIVKFNLVDNNYATNLNEDKITLITSFEQFETTVKFLNDELSKMQNIKKFNNKVEKIDNKKEIKKNDETKKVVKKIISVVSNE